MDGTTQTTSSARQACDRCGRLATELSFDEITQKDVCAACVSTLEARRSTRR